MSRKTLLGCCEQLGISTTARRGVKSGAKDNNWLRTEIIDRCYGPGFDWRFVNPAAADSACARMTETVRGRHGQALRMALYHIRCAQEARQEANRLYLLPSRPNKRVMAALAEAKTHFEKAAQFQAEHETNLKQ